MTQRRTYFQPFVSHPNLQSMCFTASLKSLLNFILLISVFFFFFFKIGAIKSQKSRNSKFFLAANTCTYRGPIFQQRARRPRIVDDLGPWELKSTKSNQRWRAEGNAEGVVGFYLVFHLFCKVSSDYRWIKQ